MIKDYFLNAFSTAINRYLHLDPASSDRLKLLNGKSIAVELLPIHVTLYCHFSLTGVTVQSDTLEATDAQLRGTPLQMMGAMLDKDNRQRFFAEDLQIEGNASVAQHALALFDQLHLDVDEHLSKWLGDIPAHHIGRTFRDMTGWLNKTKNTLLQNINEYVHEEALWLPQREALQDFFTDIDNLRMDVDRLEVRVKQLTALAHTAPTQDHDDSEAI